MLAINVRKTNRIQIDVGGILFSLGILGLSKLQSENIVICININLMTMMDTISHVFYRFQGNSLKVQYLVNDLIYMISPFFSDGKFPEKNIYILLIQ